ncbi:MAG TPA: hypothetical protein VGC77_11115 [Rhodopseudomonas sp.]|uniref:hypothetical protein n=1 Tax=Rhodopseudomonas sp. TaxID=1078 RepID=UPI002ED7C1F2
MPQKKIYGRDLDYERWLVDVGLLCGHHSFDVPYYMSGLYDQGFLRQEAADLHLGYVSYVAACHSVPGVCVSEFRFQEWVEAGKPKGGQ